jgi:hypothetical protein
MQPGTTLAGQPSPATLWRLAPGPGLGAARHGPMVTARRYAGRS